MQNYFIYLRGLIICSRNGKGCANFLLFLVCWSRVEGGDKSCYMALNLSIIFSIFHVRIFLSEKVSTKGKMGGKNTLIAVPVFRFSKYFKRLTCFCMDRNQIAVAVCFCLFIHSFIDSYMHTCIHTQMRTYPQRSASKHYLTVHHWRWRDLNSLQCATVTSP